MANKIISIRYGNINLPNQGAFILTINVDKLRLLENTKFKIISKHGVVSLVNLVLTESKDHSAPFLIYEGVLNTIQNTRFVVNNCGHFYIPNKLECTGKECLILI